MDRFIRPDTYAAWSKDGSIRYNSTSGGVFTEFAKFILSKNGLVAGAKYNDKNLVEHAIVDNYEGVEQLRQSKYMSSSMGDIYRKVRDELLTGRLVAFCGAPCQVAGLYSFLGKEYENLFTMDFICRGMNSPKAFEAWLGEIEEIEGCKVSGVWFKYKENGWKSSPRRTRLKFEDGHCKVYEEEENLFMCGYLSSNLYLRPSCGKCRFKEAQRKSDVTFADFWGIEKELDDDKGTSLLLINSEKGRDYFGKIKDGLMVYVKDFDTIYANNPMFLSSASVPESSHDFLVDLNRMKFSECLKKYGGYPEPNSLWKKLKRKIKRIIK